MHSPNEAFEKSPLLDMRPALCAGLSGLDVFSAEKGRICASKRDFDAPWDSEKLVGRPK